jgi:simple sugar transport system permease protein
VPLASLALTMGVAAAALALGGYDPARALGALVDGAVGSPDAFLSITLVRAVPLLLTGLAVTLAFRAGVWNIGAEGQLYAGAVAAVWVGLSGDVLPAPLLLPALLAASALGGAAWAWLPALLKVRRGVGEVITTLLLNFVALDLAEWMVNGPLQESRGVFPSTDEIAAAARLPLILPGTRLHWGFALAVALSVGTWFVLRFTGFGFRLRALGASPDAAAASGRIDAGRLTYRVFLMSGALAGLAGGVQIAGVTYVLYKGLSPGHGYTAIAVALLAGLHPLGVLATGTFFGALEGGAAAMQRVAAIPAAWVRGVEALVILSVIAVERAYRRVERGAGAGRSEPTGPGRVEPPGEAPLAETHAASSSGSENPASDAHRAPPPEAPRA